MDGLELSELYKIRFTTKALERTNAIWKVICQDHLQRFILPYTTQRALTTHPALVNAYLKLPFAWGLLGKQFLLAARKPGSRQ